MVVWLKRVGITLATAVGILLLWWTIPILVAVIVIVAASVYLVDRWRKWRSVRRFRAVWGVQGKDLLLVYSNSPHWQRYVEETWLPRWGHRAVVLNWSERSKWERPARAEVALFRAFAGAREFNPLGIVVPVTGRQVHIVRFWQAFRDYKHGKLRLLQAVEADLDRFLSMTVPPGTPRQSLSGARISQAD
jgi:hypothetical protein